MDTGGERNREGTSSTLRPSAGGTESKSPCRPQRLLRRRGPKKESPGGDERSPGRGFTGEFVTEAFYCISSGNAVCHTLGSIGISAFRMNASCLDLVRALDPGECHLVEEGLVSVVTHDPRQTQAFDRFLLILGYRHAPPPQYTDQQRLIGVTGFWQNLGRHAKGAHVWRPARTSPVRFWTFYSLARRPF